jgi:hypothetical protein
LRDLCHTILSSINNLWHQILWPNRVIQEDWVKVRANVLNNSRQLLIASVKTVFKSQNIESMVTCFGFSHFFESESKFFDTSLEFWTHYKLYYQN